MKWIALQTLAGGMAIGAFQASGKKPITILSESKFNANNSQLLNYWKDVEYVESNNIFDLPHFYPELDFVVSVPICSGLSLLNSSKNRGSCAVQNKNMVQNTEFTLALLKPKVFIFENAPLLYTANGQGVVDCLLELAKKYNYGLTLYKTNTILHGIPQNRPRTFALFWKDSNCPIMEYENVESNLVDYLKQIPKEATQQDIFYNTNILNTTEYKFLEHKCYCLSDYKSIRDRFFGENASSLMNLIIKKKWLDQYIEWCKINKYSSSIPEHVKKKLRDNKSYWDNSLCFASTNSIGAIQGRMYGRMVHPVEDRDFNMRELIYLMGHPHDYEINGGLKNLNMIAQNVPVHTARFIVSQAIKFINNELPLSSSNFIKQDNNKRKIDYNDINQINLGELF